MYIFNIRTQVLHGYLRRFTRDTVGMMKIPQSGHRVVSHFLEQLSQAGGIGVPDPGPAIGQGAGSLGSRRSLARMSDQPEHLGDAEGDWYYCFKHQKVEQRDECNEMDRMGPYRTAEEARNWREIVAQRNAEWDEDE